jgi:hypothetical protein
VKTLFKLEILIILYNIGSKSHGRISSNQHFIYSSGHPYLKIAKCREYLEPQVGFVEMSSLLRTDPEVYDDKKAEALKKIPFKSCN